jgi:hypothetical protein
VNDKSFPEKKNYFGMKDEEYEELLEMVRKEEGPF